MTTETVKAGQEIPAPKDTARAEPQPLERMSVREAIVKARDEVRAREDAKNAPEPKEKAPKKAPAKDEAGAEGAEEDDEHVEGVEGTPPSKKAGAGKAAAEKVPGDHSAGETGADSPDGSANEDDGKPAEKAATPASEAPKSWSKSARAQWDSLPASIQEEVLRREANATKGVQELKAESQRTLETAVQRREAEVKERYRELDEALSPYLSTIHQAGVTPGKAVKQLFDWNMALAGPNKTQAIRALAHSFGIDLASIDHSAPLNISHEQAPGAMPAELKPVLDGLSTRISAFEQHFATQQQTLAQQQQEAADAQVSQWSKDKPYFDRVRTLMATLVNSDLQLIQTGQPPVGGFVKDGKIDMDAAYNAAIYAHPEVRADILAEQDAKRAAAASAAAKKAKAAAVSIKPGATAPMPNGQAGQVIPRNETVRDSIRRALAETRGR